MDLKKLKSKLKTLQEGNKKSTSEKKDYSLTTFQPPIGKAQIRILPWANEICKEDFFETLFYYGIGKGLMVSPLNFGKKDPIDLFVQSLRAKDYTKENYYLAKKLEPKTRIFLPVIVRGEEDKGVRMWQFGKIIYEELVKFALDEETEGYEDIIEGRDFTIETVDKKYTGTGYNKTTIRPRMKITPLSKDKDLIKKWIKEQPNPLVEYKDCIYSFDEMKAALEKFLTPEEDEDEERETNVPDETNNEENTIVPKEQKALKEKKEDAFDRIFDEEEKKDNSSKEEDEDDDLPF